MGLGFATGKSEDDFNTFYCVAHYSPSGNVASKEYFMNNVKSKLQKIVWITVDQFIYLN